MLMFVILALVIIRSKIKDILKLFSPLLKWFLWSSDERASKEKMQLELAKLIESQKNVNMMDEFAKYTKLQRKIDPLKDNLNALKMRISNKHQAAYTIIGWTVSALMNIVFLCFLYYYKYDPVLTLPTNMLLPSVLTKIIAIPTGTEGNVGCVFWIMACQVTVNFVSCFKKTALNKV